MKLSKTSALAALAMAYLAQQNDSDPIQARHIATHLGIPTDSALKILQALSRRGLLHSQLGRAGGYRLHSAADTISLLDVVEAIDGPIGGELPVDMTDAGTHDSIATLRQVCATVTEGMRERLGASTVADLARAKVQV